ncbi:DUF5018 domain-containing protein [Aquimarina sp. AU474]|uniref:DUF5018 domain-containing protein n=1 Tax=Aquimarina sp. AU474 TaxID=2108529 RepID=UPI000D698A49|nr:DUF5018 domain-containing protein [Aquimarina sp. AU474]
MTKNLFRLGQAMFFSILIGCFSSCDEDEEEVILSDSNFITSFKVTSDDYEQNFEIKDNAVDGTVPYYVNEEEVQLTVIISPKASIEPNPATITSLKEPVNFIVTAENGEKREYTVHINRVLNTENSLLSLKLTSGDFEKDFEIQDDGVAGMVPYYVNNEDVSFAIELSDRATIEPDPSTITDIKKSINFVVTAENGEAKNYLVDIKRELSPEKAMLSLKLTSGDFEKDFEIQDDGVAGMVPYYINDEDVSFLIELSDRATIEPDPSTITNIKESIDFVVTAENGETKNYLIDIKRELSPEKAMLSFEIMTNLFEIGLDIDEENGRINQRIFPNTDLTSISTKTSISDRATITPDPETVMDYSTPVTYTVTAENGDTKEYVIDIALMDEDYAVQCDITNAFKWFGGDDREIDPNFPNAFGQRNVGTGQTVILKKDTYPSSFGAHFREGLASHATGVSYSGDFELKLNIRESDGTIIASKTTTVTGPFNGGWIDFDLSSLNLLLKKDTNYYFLWHLVNGEALAVTMSSTANLEETDEVHNAGGFSGQSRERDNTSLEDWDVWFPHEWHFSFRMEGKQ